ncbi:MAG: ATP synthase F1 subunit epsilon [Lachnospiraceae bacterium]|nr:ATP synthase F1 subunit epsilon [Lachnospiraceae bacterium]
MNTFRLQIVTPDGLVFDEQAQRVVVRSMTGDMAILAGHCNYCTGLGMGEARVTSAGGEVRRAACIGGMLTVVEGDCRIVATTWEWQEQIDRDRAELAKKRAEEKLAQKNLSDKEQKIAEAKLRRALVRIGVKQ